MQLKHYPIATCHICKQGWVVIVKEIATNKFLVYCNECEAEWDNPESYFDKEESTLFNFGRVTEPDGKAIKELGWEKFINQDLKN
jgi:hypothetical protein